MEPKQQQEMVNMLYLETKAGRLNWQESGANAFRLSFPQSSLVLSEGTVLSGLMLRIFNKNGDEVGSIMENIFNFNNIIPNASKLRDIYNILKSKKLRKEETISDILTRLRTSASSANELPPPPPPNIGR